MDKKYKLAGMIAIALLLVFIVWNNVWYGGKRKFYKAVPSNSILMIYANDADKTRQKLNETNYWLDWQNIELVNKLELGLQFMDSTFFAQSGGKRKKLLASLHLSKAGVYDYLMLFNKSALQGSLASHLEQFKDMGSAIEQRRFKGIDIYEIRISEKREPFTVAIAGGLLLCSFNPVLVDEAIGQRQKSINGFAKSGGLKHRRYDFSLHLNYENFKFLNTLFKENTAIASFFTELSSVAKWSKYGIKITDKALLPEGSTKLNGDNERMLRLLKQGLASHYSLPEMAPFNTAYLNYAKVKRYKSYHRKIKGNDRDVSVSDFVDWMDNEWAYGFTEPVSGGIKDVSFALLKVSDPAAAEVTFKNMIDREGVSPPPQQYKQFRVYAVNAQPFLEHLLGKNNAQLFKKAYACVVEDFVMISPGQSQLKALLENHINEQSLANEPDYLQYVEKQGNAANLMVYWQPSRLRQLLHANATPDFAKVVDRRVEYYRRLSPIAFDMDKGWFGKTNTQGLVGYRKHSKQKRALLWNVALKDAVQGEPHTVKNPKTGERKIFVQDKNNMLYLISADGRILWTRQLEQPVLGDFHVVDIYNNGDIQYFFNTRSKVYMTNEKGENFGNYPIRLSSAANAGMMLGDFDHNSNYRFFVPCGNNKIYGYEYSGRPLIAWSPRNHLALVQYPLQYFEAEDGADHIVAANDNGNVYLLQPNGSATQKVVLGSPLIAPPEIDWHNGEARIKAACENDKTYTIKPDGKYWSKAYTPLSEGSDFMTANVIGSETEENIFLSEGKVKIFNAKELIWEYEFEEGIAPSRLVEVAFAHEDTKRIGVFCEKAGKAYVLEKYGRTHPDFPISVGTAFKVADLFNAGDNILIAGGDNNNLVAYKIGTGR